MVSTAVTATTKPCLPLDQTSNQKLMSINYKRQLGIFTKVLKVDTSPYMMTILKL